MKADDLIPMKFASADDKSKALETVFLSQADRAEIQRPVYTSFRVAAADIFLVRDLLRQQRFLQVIMSLAVRLVLML
jgi:hypothetical protein